MAAPPLADYIPACALGPGRAVTCARSGVSRSTAEIVSYEPPHPTWFALGQIRDQLLLPQPTSAALSGG